MLNSRMLAPLAGTLLFGCVFSASAGINTWTSTGPDSGWNFAVAMQPTNSQLALASTQRGIYRTTNGGQDWVLVGEQINAARSIVFDPLLAGRVFVAGGAQLWVSLDAGLNYSLATAPEFGVRQVEISSGGVLYLQTYSARMFKSIDHGATWTACGTPWGADAGSNSFAVDPNPPASFAQDRLYIEILGANVTNGTWRSTDGCASWFTPGVNSPASDPDGRAYHYTVKTGAPNRVLAATNVGVKLSTDFGATWNVVTVAPAYWVEYDRVSTSKAVAITEIAHSMRSTDSGDNWVFGDALGAPEDSSFALDPQVSGRMLVATTNGLYQSTDSGVTFALRNRGMHAGTLSHVSVADDGTVYASFFPGSAGVFRRAPSGTWGPVNNTALWLATIASTNQISTVATAPSNSAIVYAGNYYTSLMRSANSGGAWQQAHQTFINYDALPYDVAVDPDNAMVAFAATPADGLFKTTDGGANWTLKNNGLPLGVTVVSAARNSNLVYAVAADPNNLFTASIYKSTNGGDTWAVTGATPIVPGMGFFNGLVIDPKDANRVYAPFHNGVYRTINGGTSWALMDFPGVSDTVIGGLSVSIDPQFSSTLLVSHTIDGAGLARTVDGGAHWNRIEFTGGSPSARQLTRALILPSKPSQIVAFPQGAGVEEYEIATDLAVGGLGNFPPLGISSTFDMPYIVKNYGPHGASPSKLSIGFPTWMTPTVPANCTRTGQTLDCDIPALNVDELVQVTVPYAISAAGGNGTLTASLTGHETELITGNNTYSQAVTASERADLALSFTPDTAWIDRTGSATVVAKVTNDGPSPSTATTLMLQIPAGLSWTAPTPSTGSCSQSGQTITCSLGSLAVDASASVSLPLQGTVAGTQVVSGSATGAGADTDSDQNATMSVVVGPLADLTVSLAESADPVNVGEELTYTMTLRNLSGDAGLSSVVMPITGAKLTGVQATPGVTCGADLINNVASCTSQSLAAGATGVGYAHVTGSTPGIATATATTQYLGRDSNTTNNVATIGTNIRLAGDASVEISDSKDPASAWEAFTYTVTVRNGGPNAGPVNVAIPVTGANVTNVTTSSGTCAMGVTAANCTITALASGASAVINVTVVATTAGTASATATASFGGFDPVTANNSAIAETQVRVVADIDVAIAESADPVTAGGVLTYRVTLTTAGPSSGNVHLSVPVTGSTVTGATPSQGGSCAIASGTVTCDFAPMDFSPSTVDILVNSATAGTVTAVATATFSGTDPVTTNNSATVSTTVNPAPSSSSSSGGGGGGSSSGGGSSGGGSSGSSGGGGGGGGHFDWLAAGLLGTLVAFRRRRRVTAG